MDKANVTKHGRLHDKHPSFRLQEGQHYVYLIVTDRCRAQTSVVSCALLTFCRNISSSLLPVPYHDVDSAIGNTTTLADTHTHHSCAAQLIFLCKWRHYVAPWHMRGTALAAGAWRRCSCSPLVPLLTSAVSSREGKKWQYTLQLELDLNLMRQWIQVIQLTI